MNPTNNTIAILGGAGKAGLPTVKQALLDGYSVRLLLRHPESFPLSHERLTIIPGDARDSACLRNLLTGSQAVISTLGHPKGEVTPIQAAVADLLITAMKEAGIKRYIVVSSLFDTGTEHVDAPTKQAADFMEQHFPHIMADRRKEFQLLGQSPLDWTYVRIPMLHPGAATGQLAVRLNQLPTNQIMAGDLAQFLISQLADTQYVRQALFVGSR